MVSGSGSGGVDRIGGAGADGLLAAAHHRPGAAIPPGAPVGGGADPRWTNRRLRGHGATSIGKVHQGDLNQRIQLAAVDLLGAGPRPGKEATWTRPRWGMLRSRANTIEGGTTEVNKNVIGERVLGLPREPDPYRAVRVEGRPRS